MNQTLTIDLTVINEQHDDEYAFRVKELGCTVYANDKDNGPRLVAQATNALLDSFQGDQGAMFGYLDSHNVLYRVCKDSKEQPSLRSQPPYPTIRSDYRRFTATL